MLEDSACLTHIKGQFDLTLMILCQLWTLYATKLQHRQMIMNDLEVRHWNLVIACVEGV